MRPRTGVSWVRRDVVAMSTKSFIFTWNLPQENPRSILFILSINFSVFLDFHDINFGLIGTFLSRIVKSGFILLKKMIPKLGYRELKYILKVGKIWNSGL